MRATERPTVHAHWTPFGAVIMGWDSQASYIWQQKVVSFTGSPQAVFILLAFIGFSVEAEVYSAPFVLAETICLNKNKVCALGGDSGDRCFHFEEPGSLKPEYITFLGKVVLSQTDSEWESRHTCARMI